MIDARVNIAKQNYRKHCHIQKCECDQQKYKQEYIEKAIHCDKGKNINLKYVATIPENKARQNDEKFVQITQVCQREYERTKQQTLQQCAEKTHFSQHKPHEVERAEIVRFAILAKIENRERASNKENKANSKDPYQPPFVFSKY